MINKTKKEIYDFSSNIKTSKNSDELLNYINHSFYSSIKLLISISKVFSIYWKVVLPIIITISILTLLSLVEKFPSILSTEVSFAILAFLIAFTFYYISSSKKYLIHCIEEIKKTF